MRRRGGVGAEPVLCCTTCWLISSSCCCSSSPFPSTSAPTAAASFCSNSFISSLVSTGFCSKVCKETASSAAAPSEDGPAHLG